MNMTMPNYKDLHNSFAIQEKNFSFAVLLVFIECPFSIKMWKVLKISLQHILLPKHRDYYTVRDMP